MKLQALLAATDIVNTPRAHDLLRWQRKIGAWRGLNPTWAGQMDAVVHRYIDEAGTSSP